MVVERYLDRAAGVHAMRCGTACMPRDHRHLGSALTGEVLLDNMTNEPMNEMYGTN